MHPRCGRPGVPAARKNTCISTCSILINVDCGTANCQWGRASTELLGRTHDTQCQHTACLAFIAHFTQRGEVCTSSTPRKPLSSQELEWLKIKHRTLRLSSNPRINNYVFSLWILTDTNRRFISPVLTYKAKQYQQFDVQLEVVSERIVAVGKKRILNAEQLEESGTKRRKAQHG